MVTMRMAILPEKISYKMNYHNTQHISPSAYLLLLICMVCMCVSKMHAQESCYEQYLREHNMSFLTAEDADDSYEDLKKAVLAKQIYGDSYLLMADTIAQRMVITKVDGTYIADVHLALVDSTWSACNYLKGTSKGTSSRTSKGTSSNNYRTSNRTSIGGSQSAYARRNVYEENLCRVQITSYDIVQQNGEFLKYITEGRDYVFVYDVASQRWVLDEFVDYGP